MNSVLNASRPSKQTILIIGTLDTKGEECVYIRDRIQQNGFGALLIDSGPLGSPLVPGDITRYDVAEKAGVTLEALTATRDKGKIIQTMTDGVTLWVAQLFRKEKIHGVIAVGGGQGTAIGTDAMQCLPLGFPKVMVSTVASGNMRRFIHTSDIAVFPSVTDVFGLNSIFTRILDNAVNALMGMARHYQPIEKGDIKSIGATAFGVVTPGLMKMKKILNEKGFEMILFHATGMGGRALEELVATGYFDGVMDWTTHEIVDEIGKGIFASGKDRLDVLSKTRTPYIIAPGGIDYICKGPWQEMTTAWKKRNFYAHNRNITSIRTTPREMTRAANFIAKKVNRAVGPVTIMIPTRGFSEPNAEGKQFYDPETDRVFVNTLKRQLKSCIDLIEIDAHINDDVFVREAVDRMLGMLGMH